MPRMGRSLVALVVAVAVLTAGAAGCSKKKKDKPQGSADTTAASTTTTVDTGPKVPSPLTGLPMPEALAKRGLLIVKIDNSPQARPQLGLAEADVVFEHLVEGGQTRFAALYHSTDAAEVGPVRSARSTDMNLATSFNRPLFAYSGANAAFQVLLRRAVFVDVGLKALPDAYTRRPDRRPTSDLFTSTGALYAGARFPGSAPVALWAFRAAGAPAVAGPPASEASIDFAGPAATKVRWLWDAGAGGWRREQDGSAHVDGTGKEVRASNVIVHFVNYKDSLIRDRTSAPVPEAQLVGEGSAWILVDGKVIRGRWNKSSLTQATVYVDESGKPVELRPGRTWVELAPPGSASLVG